MKHEYRIGHFRNIILLPRQTHPGPSGHPSQEGTTPDCFAAPTTISQEGNLWFSTSD